MKFNIITIFPEIITDYCNAAILGRAQKNNCFSVKAVQLRDFAVDKHKTVDDTPYGGGAGMVMKPDVLYAALKNIDAIPFSKTDGLTKVKKIFNGSLKSKKRTILLSPRGRQFTQSIAEEWSKLNEITFVCGRYEGIDERVVDHMVDEEISVGPYVLAGGELGALIIIEAIARLLPGVLGNPESLTEETHSLGDQVEYPHYTKPATFKGWKVPAILLSGDHKKIAQWRFEQGSKNK
jgi:tRNA (guanine37-N1)-methyltransferase